MTGLKKGETYYVAITTYNTSGSESGYSIEASGVATETTLPVSETLPTVATSPSSEPTSTPETTPMQRKTPPLRDTTGGRSAGGCSREAIVASPPEKYIGTHPYLARWVKTRCFGAAVY